MPIEFACESCKKLLRVPDGSGGLSCECPACRTLLEIPDPDAVKVVEAADKHGDSGEDDNLCIACPKCAHELVCSAKLLGTKGQCKNCKYIFTIAKGTSSTSADEDSSSGLVFTCPQCGQLFEGREEMRGRKGKCHACGEVFPIQLHQAEGPTATEKPVQKTLKRASAQPKPKKQPSARSPSPAAKKQSAAAAPPIQFTCSSCNGVMQVPAAAAGQTTSCPYCQQLQQIPAKGAPQTNVAPQAALDDSPFSQPMAPAPLDNWADLGDLSGGATNPYAAPAMSSYSAPAAPKKTRTRRSRRVADLGKRFLGAMVDGICGVLSVVPGYAIMISSTVGNPDEPPPLFFVGVGVLILGALVLFVVHVYLLATRSQTIGKFVVKTQIVDADTYQPAGLVSTVLLRSIVNGIIGSIPCIGPIYTLVDICFIFRDDHRCVHDLLANTIVVDIS